MRFHKNFPIYFVVGYFSLSSSQCTKTWSATCSIISPLTANLCTRHTDSTNTRVEDNRRNLVNSQTTRHTGTQGPGPLTSSSGGWSVSTAGKLARVDETVVATLVAYDWCTPRQRGISTTE